MNARHVSIAAASLAALVMGIGPAAAQTSAKDSPSTPGGSVTVNPSVDTRTNTDVKTGADVKTNTDVSPSTSSGTQDRSSPSASPSGTDANTKSDANRDTKDDSLSASPRGDEGKTKSDDSGDRQKMKDLEKIDKKAGQDRADDTAGDRGGHGRDTAGMPGSSR